MVKQKNIWAFNICTGDVCSNKHWREYYDTEMKTSSKKGRTKFNHIKVGSIVGCLLDMDRGIINFFLDGKDLG